MGTLNKVTQMLWFHFWYTHVLPTHCLPLTDEEWRTERVRNSGLTCLPFPSASSFLAGVRGSYGDITPVRKDRLCVLGFLRFLEYHCLLSGFEASFYFEWKAWSLRAYSVIHVTHLPGIHFEFCWAPVYHGPTRIQGPSPMLFVNGAARNGDI